MCLLPLSSLEKCLLGTSVGLHPLNGTTTTTSTTKHRFLAQTRLFWRLDVFLKTLGPITTLWNTYKPHLMCGRQRPWDHKQLSRKPDLKLGSLSQSCPLSCNPQQPPMHAAGCVSVKDSVLGPSWCRLTAGAVWPCDGTLRWYKDFSRIHQRIWEPENEIWQLTTKASEYLFSAFMWAKPWLVTLHSPVSLCDPRQSSAVVALWECASGWMGAVCAGLGLWGQWRHRALQKYSRWGGEVDLFPVTYIPNSLSDERVIWPEYADRMAATFFLFFSICVLLFNCVSKQI